MRPPSWRPTRVGPDAGSTARASWSTLAATDSDAAAVWGEAVSALADALVQVCALLAPGAILLAGGLSEAGAALTEPVRTLMLERSRVATVPPVLASELGGRAGLVGASQLALEAVA